MASSCDDDFGLLGDEAQSHHIHIHPHPHPHAHPHSHHPQPQQAAPSPFVTHRFVTTGTTKGAVPIHAHHPFNSIASSKKGVGGGGGDDDEEDDDPGDYGEAFAQADASSKLPTPNAFHHDVNPHHCFAPADAATDHPFTHQTQGGDEDGTENHGHKLAVGAPAAHPSRPDVKRKDRDELSDGGSPYCFNSSGGNGKKPRAPSASSGMPSSSSGDYRKDREEWSDSGIGCLLDAYTEKYIQLNRGNLRGRDWEDVASIVSERCDKQKSCKSVEQCKNKVDNLKKRYKAERQRLSSGSLSVSHWPWFKKMEQIVGSSSSSSSKPVSDDDKSAAAPGGGCGGGGGASATAAAPPRQAKRYSVATPGPVSLTNNLKMKALSNPRWRRVVLKISGAAFAGNGPQNVDPKVTMLIAREIAIANRLGVEVAIVVGGRNFFCGDTWAAATGIDRSTAYQIGMMATMMNSILLQASLEKIGVQTRVQTAFTIQEIAEPYIRRRAIRHLEKGRVVIFGGIGAGIGNPLFTTDTAAALRASEINADAVLKGTNIDGAYDCHSRDSNNTAAFDHLSFRELVSRGFTAMDMTAISFCEENSIPVVVFNLLEPGNISRAICGDQVGTLIDQSGRAG